jgi:hypothetical protein
MGLQCGEKGVSSKHQMGKLTMVGREACLLQLCPPTPSEPQGMRPPGRPYTGDPRSKQASPGPALLRPKPPFLQQIQNSPPPLPTQGEWQVWGLPGLGKETPAIGHFSRLGFQAPPLSPLRPHKGAAVCSVIRSALFRPEEKPGPADGR